VARHEEQLELSNLVSALGPGWMNIRRATPLAARRLREAEHTSSVLWGTAATGALAASACGLKMSAGCAPDAYHSNSNPGQLPRALPPCGGNWIAGLT